MKRLLMKLFRCAEQMPAPEAINVPASAPTPTATPRKPSGKRKYSSNGKRRRPAPPGARKIDPNGPLIEQARQVRGGNNGR
ncbi:hypothetical protein [Ralstonia pseudosolanacearum]|uniref:hypothetical protein n=1 Tax=Ralstonia pseudosolanacearum TaxID=1310165 RepID=UPI003AAD32CC